MTETLLATKLHMPAARPDSLSRRRLLALLDAGQEANLTLVAAPAGFGKSTLVAAWLSQRPFRSAWLSLDERDNDPVRFWRYVLAALGHIDPTIGAASVERLNAGDGSSLEPLIVALINDLSADSGDLYLILDDYHVIDNHVVHESIQFLLENQPPALHLILLTRVDPPLRLSRLRARQQLNEIRADALQFTAAETAALMNDLMNLELDSSQVAALTQRTEGWIAGLQLAGLSLKSQADHRTFIEQFTGSHQYILDYLTEEVLLALPEILRLFLMQTAVLERMCADLCHAISDDPNSHALFETILRHNLFVIPLDHEGQWFRYHHLFGDLLLARLPRHFPAEQINTLHRRATDWYEQHGFMSDAIHHARISEDYDRMAALVDRAGQTMIFADHYTLKRWLDWLPDGVFQTHPRLEVYRTLIELSQGRLDMSEQTLLEKEHTILALPPSPENDHLRQEAMAYLCLFMAHQNTSRTIQMAQEALAATPEGNLKVRAFLFSALYRAYGMQGEIDKSTPAYQECLHLSQAAGDYGMVSVTTMVRAFDLCQYGRLDEAAMYCQTIIDAGEQIESRPFYQAGPSYIGLAGLHLERHDLETAEAYLARGLELCRQSGMDGLYTGTIQRARLLQAKGDYEGAAEVLHRMEQALQRWDFTLAARQVSLRLAMNDLDGVSRLAAPLLGALDDRSYARRLPLIAQEAFKLCLARIFHAGGEPDRASQMLDDVQASAEPGQRAGRLLEFYLLRALIEHERHPDSVSHQAIAHLERALELAESGGFVLLVLEEGQAMIPLLNAVSQPYRPYARRLLNAFAGSRPSAAAGAAPGLVESLTPREMDVLQLIAIGDSNQVIADKLFITVRTVKKHITSILGKLAASNRTQAVARARDLGLITFD